MKLDKRPERLNAEDAVKGISPSSIIGNCRLCTSGTYKEVENNQPIAVGRLAVSHNGNIRSYLQIAREHGIQLSSECDSEIIAHLVFRYGIERALELLESEMPMALLLLQNNKITAFRKGLPLYHLRTDAGHYLCSRQFMDSEQLPEGSIFEFGGEADGTTHTET